MAAQFWSVGGPESTQADEFVQAVRPASEWSCRLNISQAVWVIGSFWPNPAVYVPSTRRPLRPSSGHTLHYLLRYL